MRSPERRALEQSAAREPADPQLQERLARRLLAEQDLAALDRLQRRLDANFAQHAFTHLLAGHAAKARGDADGARRRYQQALELRPMSGEALYNLVDLGGAPPDGPLGQRARELAQHEDLPAADRINGGFALGRLLENAGDAEGAFDSYRRANDLALATLAGRGLKHDEAQAQRQLEADLANWQAQSFTSPLPPADIDLYPVFVVGLPRSGTTLVEQILASHPDACAGGELSLGPEVEHGFRLRLGLAPCDPLPDPGDPALREALERARERYLEGLFERGLDARWIVDKLPANARIAGFLRLLFPDSPILHCSRDPRALAWSLYTANFAAHEPWVHDLAAMVGVLRRHRCLLAHWEQVLPAPFIKVVYEELVGAPQQRIPELLDACGIPFHPAALHPEALDRPVFTASHAQVRRPIHTGAVERWRPQEGQLRAFAELDR